MDEAVPPPATFAFSWLSGLLLYGTPNDDGAPHGTPEFSLIPICG